MMTPCFKHDNVFYHVTKGRFFWAVHRRLTAGRKTKKVKESHGPQILVAADWISVDLPKKAKGRKQRKWENHDFLGIYGDLCQIIFMINLSQETEALAKRLAAAQSLSVEDAIRLALEEKARAAVAARHARTNRFVAELAAMPVLDRRSPNEIMDDLNAL
jgi:antitoxin VapB